MNLKEAVEKNFIRGAEGMTITASSNAINAKIVKNSITILDTFIQDMEREFRESEEKFKSLKEKKLTTEEQKNPFAVNASYIQLGWSECLAYMQDKMEQSRNQITSSS